MAFLRSSVVALLGAACVAGTPARADSLSHPTPTHAALAVPAVPVVPGNDAARFKTILAGFERDIDAVMASGQMVGLGVAVVHRGEVVLARGYGVGDAKRLNPVDDRTVFRLASLSKGLASTTLALLVRDGFVEWDEPVQSLVPMFELSDSRAATQVTLRDLLSHRVGLPYNALDRVLEGNEPYPLLVYKLRDLPLTCKPGDCYAYQNIAYSVVGDIAFATTGRFYSYEVERRLFHPLGMTDSTFGRDALEANPNHAMPHVRGPRGFVPVRPKETYYRVLPAAGANASVRDMAQWALAQLGHHPELLPADLLEELHAPEVATPGETRSVPWRRERVREAQYALGFRVYDYAGHRMVFHGGAVQGYRGMLALLPGHDLGIVVLWNNESAAPSGLVPTLLDRYLGLPAANWLAVNRLAKAPPARAAPRRKPPPKSTR
jgi:beta-lactamase class C